MYETVTRSKLSDQFSSVVPRKGHSFGANHIEGWFYTAVLNITELL